jgi:glycosyltransferase involved in cell wall biosynthesis
MKIHGLCLVKNEADIIEYSLGEASRWCNFIYVLDNGSTDETWRLVRELAVANPRIVPWKSETIPFDNALRGLIFAEFRNRAKPGDWWCRLDADEIYIDPPRDFLTAVPARFQVVWAAHLQYYLTAQELERFQSLDEERPPKISTANLPRHYLANSSEARFFRHRDGLVWDGGAWPRHVGLVSPRRIRLKHFQNRSPAQIQSRLDTRHLAIAQGNVDFPHIVHKNWREALSTDELHTDCGDGNYVIDERQLPRHLEPFTHRLLKLIFHTLHIWP